MVLDPPDAPRDSVDAQIGDILSAASLAWDGSSATSVLLIKLIGRLRYVHAPRSVCYPLGMEKSANRYRSFFRVLSAFSIFPREAFTRVCNQILERRRRYLSFLSTGVDRRITHGSQDQDLGVTPSTSQSFCSLKIIDSPLTHL